MIADPGATIVSALDATKAPRVIPNHQHQKLLRLLSHRRAISTLDLLNELEVSRPTLTRYLRDLRDTYGVPVVFDRDQDGYRLESDNHELGRQFELPGQGQNFAGDT